MAVSRRRDKGRLFFWLGLEETPDSFPHFSCVTQLSTETIKSLLIEFLPGEKSIQVELLNLHRFVASCRQASTWKSHTTDLDTRKLHDLVCLVAWTEFGNFFHDATLAPFNKKWLVRFPVRRQKNGAHHLTNWQDRSAVAMLDYSESFIIHMSRMFEQPQAHANLHDDHGSRIILIQVDDPCLVRPCKKQTLLQLIREYGKQRIVTPEQWSCSFYGLFSKDESVTRQILSCLRIWHISDQGRPLEPHRLDRLAHALARLSCSPLIDITHFRKLDKILSASLRAHNLGDHTKGVTKQPNDGLAELHNVLDRNRTGEARALWGEIAKGIATIFAGDHAALELRYLLRQLKHNAAELKLKDIFDEEDDSLPLSRESPYPEVARRLRNAFELCHSRYFPVFEGDLKRSDPNEILTQKFSKMRLGYDLSSVRKNDFATRSDVDLASSSSSTFKSPGVVCLGHYAHGISALASDQSSGSRARLDMPAGVIDAEPVWTDGDRSATQKVASSISPATTSGTGQSHHRKLRLDPPVDAQGVFQSLSRSKESKPVSTAMAPTSYDVSGASSSSSYTFAEAPCLAATAILSTGVDCLKKKEDLEGTRLYTGDTSTQRCRLVSNPHLKTSGASMTPDSAVLGPSNAESSTPQKRHKVVSQAHSSAVPKIWISKVNENSKVASARAKATRPTPNESKTVVVPSSSSMDLLKSRQPMSLREHQNTKLQPFGSRVAAISSQDSSRGCSASFGSGTERSNKRQSSACRHATSARTKGDMEANPSLAEVVRFFLLCLLMVISVMVIVLFGFDRMLEFSRLPARRWIWK